jgi:hypothetical protein
VRRSDLADDDVGHCSTLEQAVVGADDSQGTGGDGVADELGGGEQLSDGVAQMLAPDVLRVELGDVGRARSEQAAVDGGLDALDEPGDVRGQGRRLGPYSSEPMTELEMT